MTYPKGKPKSEESKRRTSESMRRAYMEGRRPTAPPGVTPIKPPRPKSPKPPMPTCSISGCLKTAFCKGWCNTHYQRWRRHGDPNARVRIDKRPTAPGMWWCSRCQELKPEDQFQSNAQKIYCTQCIRERRQIKNYGVCVQVGDQCEICGSDTDIVIDHCHRSGNTRGRLCRRCNSCLGLLGDDIALFGNAIAYLRAHAVQPTQ